MNDWNTTCKIEIILPNHSSSLTTCFPSCWNKSLFIYLFETRIYEMSIFTWKELSFEHTSVIQICFSQLLNCYLEAYQHVTDPEERLGLAQIITNITHRRPQIDFTAGYFVQSYRDTIICLQSHKELIRQVLNTQVIDFLLSNPVYITSSVFESRVLLHFVNKIDEQRRYLERIWRERPSGFECDYGLPPNYIPKHLVSIGGCW